MPRSVVNYGCVRNSITVGHVAGSRRYGVSYVVQNPAASLRDVFFLGPPCCSPFLNFPLTSNPLTTAVNMQDTTKPLIAWEVNQEVALRMTSSGMGAFAPQTVVDAFRTMVKRVPNSPAYHTKTNGVYTHKTWAQYFDDCRTFGKALIALGCDPFDTVNIIGFNAIEWVVANMGSILAGCVSAGVYTTSNPQSCHYIAEHSEARVVVCDGVAQLEKYVSMADKLPKLKALVIYNDVVPEGLSCSVPVYSFPDFMKLGRDVQDAVLERRMDAQKPGNCCSLIYTSGTTGNPKAVMLSHDNLTWTVEAVAKHYENTGVVLNHECTTVSYLPLSHIAAQLFDMYLPMARGVQTYFAQPDALKGSLGTTLKEARPTFVFAVPRVWEKMMEKMISVGRGTKGAKKALVDWAKSVGMTKSKQAQFGKSGGTPCGYAIAQKLVFAKVRAALGMDRTKVMLSAAAPISPETVNFFAALDIPIFELFGQSECTGPTSFAVPGAWKIGTVGRPMEGTQMKVVDGTQELIYQGRNTMMGYLKSETATVETIDAQGWLHSGDCGKLDEDNFCMITGRIKELIITAGGENIPPVLLEDAIKEEIPLLSNVMAIGDRRKFLTAVLTLKVVVDADGNPTDQLDGNSLAIMKEIDSSATTVAQAKECAKVKAYIDKNLKKANGRAASRAQHIQKYHILDKDFSIAGDELTATLKLKRRIVMAKYEDVIEAMYA
ncbi:Aste57867_9392 [Aphanomyces stellatus]|uniref:Aste57867_9392 protein n=1 Tax=Aphanomyces stellatus TaxID=120398 RepID=A0A485KMX9_9STRA|nr:hypothetical protein As57867_009356 [Aphanomyces stellatus]VFT86272.1 Aste57867_9392 [Aphanomyces stellatus]